MDEIVREFLVESYENLDQLDQDLVALEETPGSTELLGRVFRTIHTIKGTCGFLAFSRLERVTHAGESLLSELRDGRRAMDQPTTDVLLRMVDTVREILASIETSGGEGDIAVDAVIAQMRGVLNSPAAQSEPDGDADAEPPMPATGMFADEPGSPTASESSIRVEVDVLDSLMRQVGELVLARNQISRLAGGQLDADLTRSSQRLSLIASELQTGVMKARMQPIGQLWAKMPRIVRDLASICGRQVRLEVSGGGTELDRALLEAVKDPLLHLVRNAVDHGIEDSPTRLAAGKHAVGVLTLRAYHASGQVVVEVVDDGKGIDVGRVAARAMERGLRTPAQIAAMSEPDVLQLLFLPGFSMAEAVTKVSGRGVGLDIVHTKIGAIGGTVEVESAMGRGTTWRLRIPLTLAIISALIVESAGELYSIPAVNLLEFVAPGANIEYVGVAAVLRLRGTLLPLIELRSVLGLPDSRGPDQKGERGSRTVIAVLQTDTRRFGLIVDRVWNTEEIVVKPLTARLRGVGVYAGATLLGDGRVSLILDVPAIAARSLSGQMVESDLLPSAGQSMPVGIEGQVLVVGIGGGRRVAIPLAIVTRLERLRTDVVEHVGDREVFQYRNGIVPLIRLGRLLGRPAAGDPATRDSADGDLDEELLVVMSTRGTRTVGIAVEEILDIVDDDATRHSRIDEQGVVGSTVLGKRVTERLDVRHVVLSGDPSFYDDAADDGNADDVTHDGSEDAASDPYASAVGSYALGSVAV